MNKQKLLFTLVLAAALPMMVQAQRLQQSLGRGVVVAKRVGTSRTGEGGSGTLVSWRKLAQEPEGTTYNVYERVSSASSWHKLNATPLTQTNYSIASASANAQYAVTAIVDGIEGDKSEPFTYKVQAWDNVWFDIDFDDTVIRRNDYRTKYVWPMDLDGDGEVDAMLVDRLYAGAASGDDEEGGDNTATTSHKIQAYRLDGTLLWTIDMGPNVNICAGQNDMLLAYDINCDGRCEVLLRSSDGTRFWNKTAETWGTYVGGKSTGDIDGDGIIDYRTQTVKNPPFYISVVDGMTGEELAYNELKYSELSDGSDSYGRNNRSSYMSFGYGAMEGHFGIAYHDGIHPSLVMECEDRDTGKLHHGYILTWDYDWSSGQPTNWHHSHTWVRNPKSPGCAEFHQIRILDADGDGCDEMWGGGYGVNPHQDRFISTGLAHGDRFIISDIDPDLPGIEGFAIQQSALLGQCLYSAATGKRLREWYLPSVYDVGRGACMDIDPKHKGYEMYSFADDYIYNSKGGATGETRSQWNISTMFEGIWWNGDLLREEINSPGGKGYQTNMMVTTVRGKARLIEFSRETNWNVNGGTGTRPAFMGDIIGDWREEIILAKQADDHSLGITGFTTAMPSDYSIYCLQQDPHYRGDCTTRGYYQHPNTSFYLGADMPLPPLPPVFTADLRWKGGNIQNIGLLNGFTPESGFTSFDLSADAPYAEGKSLIFDVYGDNSSKIYINQPLNAPVIYLMNPRGHNYDLQSTHLWGTDAIVTTGTGQLIKSMQGKATLSGWLRHTGKTLISEGTLEVNGDIAGPVELRAKGTLSGNVTLKDTITFEGALNYEGCRLMPGTDIDYMEGVIESKKSMVIPGDVYLEVTAGLMGNSSGTWGVCSHLRVEGDLTFNGTNYITVNLQTKDAAEYVIAECTGTLTADVQNLKVRGLVGLNYTLEVRDHQLVLVIHEGREAATDVVWTGAENGLWDYQSANFSLNDEATTFVANDAVVFTDVASTRIISLTDMMVTSGVHFIHDTGTYTFNGEGGFSGTGDWVMDGTGKVVLNSTKSDYTGKAILNRGTVTVKDMQMAGTASCLGAGRAIEMGKATLIINNTNATTDRNITLTDTATISVATGSATFQSAINGSGVLVKKGAGQVSFTYGGANNYAGTILNAGTLAMGAWNTTIGRATSPIEVTGNSAITIFNNNSTTAVPSLQNTITVNRNKTLTINGGQRCAVQGKWLGNGTVKISFPYVRGDVSTDVSQFEGTVNVTSGQYRLTTAMNLKNGTFEPDAGVYVTGVKGGSGTEVQMTHSIGSLTGTASDAQFATGTWNVGYLNKNSIFAGFFNGNATLNKYGTGNLTLTGSSACPINIYAGSVQADNATGTTTGTVTVESGGMFCGIGKAASVNIKSGGTIGGGRAAGSICGTLTLTGSLTVRSGANIRLRARAAQIDALNVSGKTTLMSPHFLIERTSGEWQTETEYQILNGTGTITLSGTPTFEPEIPMEGYEWDYSRLTEGVLMVKENPATAIEELTIDSKTLDNNTYDLQGRKVNTQHSTINSQLPKGIYIIKGKKYLVK